MAKDYPRAMHSLEHILNGTIARMLGCGRAFSSHIETRKSKCDYRFDRDLTSEEIDRIIGTVNDVVAQDLTITASEMSRDKAAELFNLDRLPESSGDRLRIVHVGDYDHCPCIGEHVERTSHIGGGLRIISTDWADGVLRVRFKIDMTN